MKAALHVGRVGALAIALGIGAGISATGGGVAWADATDGPGPATASGPQADSGSSRADNAAPSRGEQSARPAGRRPAVGNGRSVASDSDPAAIDVKRSDRTPAPHPAAAVPARPAFVEKGPADPDLTPPGLGHLPQAAPRPVAAVPPVDATLPRKTPVAVIGTVLAAPPAAAVSAQAVAQPVSPSQAVRITPPPAVVRVLAALFGSTPGGTVDSPVNWMVLAAARRQSGTTAARTAVPAATTIVVNKPPVITNVVLGAPNSTTGAVTGTVTASDPNADKITYKATTSTKGSVSITTAGVFAYTPTATARHAAAKLGATTAATTDSVTVTVTDAKGAATARVVTVPILGKNAAPTATKAVGTPNSTTGVVAGKVTGADADADPLTYTATKPASGAVTLNADGSFAYTPTTAARTSASTSTTTKTDTFTITVADGYGGSKAVSVTAAIAPTYSAPPAGQLSRFCGCTLMPANTVFHADVSSLPVLAKSSTWTTLLGGNLFAAWGGEQWMGNTAGMPVNTVAATRPGETVIFNRGYSTSGPSIDNTPYAIPDRPLVEGMPSAPAWDRHLLVFQEGTCVSQELYNVANGVELPASGFGDALANSIYAGQYGSAWIAEAGVHYNMNSPLYPVKGWANASQLPYLPLILRPDDLSRGSIDHMLGITIAKDRGTGYAWPARAGDGTGTNPNGVPMGTVFRLRADFDISKYDPSTQVILRALQQHGAVVYDSGNPGQSGATLLAMSNGWTGTGYLTAQQQLRTIPLSAFEAVDVLSLAADPATGWTIRSTV